MAALERSVLDFYQINTAYPELWPADRDNDSDGSDDGAAASSKEKERKAKLNRRKSRYQALERAATQRTSTMPGAEKGVQRDEPDPLGTTDSVILALKRNGAKNVQDDPKLRMSSPPPGALRWMQCAPSLTL